MTIQNEANVLTLAKAAKAAEKAHVNEVLRNRSKADKAAKAEAAKAAEAAKEHADVVEAFTVLGIADAEAATMAAESVDALGMALALSELKIAVASQKILTEDLKAAKVNVAAQLRNTAMAAVLNKISLDVYKAATAAVGLKASGSVVNYAYAAAEAAKAEGFTLETYSGMHVKNSRAFCRLAASAYEAECGIGNLPNFDLYQIASADSLPTAEETELCRRLREGRFDTTWLVRGTIAAEAAKAEAEAKAAKVRTIVGDDAKVAEAKNTSAAWSASAAAVVESETRRADAAEDDLQKALELDSVKAVKAAEAKTALTLAELEAAEAAKVEAEEKAAASIKAAKAEATARFANQTARFIDFEIAIEEAIKADSMDDIKAALAAYRGAK